MDFPGLLPTNGRLSSLYMLLQLLGTYLKMTTEKYCLILYERVISLYVRMTPQLIFEICNIADFRVELRIVICNSAITWYIYKGIIHNSAMILYNIKYIYYKDKVYCILVYFILENNIIYQKSYIKYIEIKYILSLQ